MPEVISLLESIHRNMEDNIYNYTKDGKCSGCGNCCTNLLPMNSKEIKKIRRYIQKNNIQECKHLIPLANKPYDMTCPFLDTDKHDEKCRIYEVRPMICQKFICDSEKKAKLTRQEVGNTRWIVNAREEFFGN